MKVHSNKGYRLNYEATHRKIQETIERIVQEGGELTVAKVAEQAGICQATAYNHKCPDMIRQALKEK